MATIQLKIISKENGKTINIGLEENTTVQGLLLQLRSKGVIETDQSYYLVTTDGAVCTSASKFQEFREREFELIQGLPRLPAFFQLGIFILDGSGSMREGLIGNQLPCEVVDAALRKTISRFSVSRKSECFSFSVIAFGDHAKIMLAPKTVTRIDTAQSFIPTGLFNNGKGSGTTNIASGLEIALEQAKTFFANKKGNMIYQVAVVILTDGMCHHEDETRELAKQLNQIPNVEIYACHLETGVNRKDAVNLLKDISKEYATVYDEETIRNFFVASASRVNGTPNPSKYNAG